MITKLLQYQKTVFTTEELKKIFWWTKDSSLLIKLSRYKQAGKLLNPQKWIWTLPIFSEEELVCTLFPQSYISLESILYEEGIIFQRYGDSTRVIRKNTRQKEFQNHHYYAYKIKDQIFLNSLGIREENHIRKATPERALCDLIYLQQKPQIDNPDFFHNEQSKARFEQLLPLYPKTTQHVIRQLLKY